MKVELDLPYPEIRVEEKNEYYADLLSQNYAGEISETTATFLYTYQHFNTFKDNKEFSNVIEKISIVEMKHLEMLGKLIKLLGKNPVYETCESSRGNCVMWNANNVNYTTDLKQMILIDIKAEKAAIRNYVNHRDIIEDKYIKEILSRIILDEERHLEIFELLYNDLKNKLILDN